MIFFGKTLNSPGRESAGYSKARAGIKSSLEVTKKHEDCCQPTSLVSLPADFPSLSLRQDKGPPLLFDSSIFFGEPVRVD